MARRMLIDATHPEETRVVVLNGTKLEEFDFETSTKKQIKGNIYLAKITRVEPSLQAAFVEYGGNRHGFLAFSEIHPDYYRIPVSDREAMIAAERRAQEEGRDDEDGAPDGGPTEEPSDEDPGSESNGHDAPEAEAAGSGLGATAYQPAGDAEPASSGNGEDHDDHEPGATESAPENGDEAQASAEHDDEAHEPAVPLETVGGDELEEVQTRPRVRHYRNYKIQEVIKRRQILLIQVTKEERGNKGAALTTYLSLAGRYCVLMPNAGRGGGVSRKITSATDRRRLKELMEELDLPDGMGVIVRTAGSERSKAEIKRDYEYLLRLWDDIRELTLRSSAPALIYEEGNLIKRAIRDLYARDIEEIQVEGEEGYRTAKEFMRMLMPSHASRVRAYRDPAIPLFHRFQIDAQIDQIHNPVVQLRSGGYIVINPTEALVSIDVNSGRATRERNIEETATKTNQEAAEEIARQLRLRDLAGLVVIDFIDMEEGRNQRSVEARLKDAMKLDRARIQLGRISPFGLLELSRQRLRSSLIEASTQPCPHCNGTGTIRSTESTALVVLRALEEEGIKRRTAELSVFVPTPIALYILNQKRETLTGIEHRYGFRVTVCQDDALIPPDHRLDRVRAMTPAELAALPAPAAAPVVEEEEEEQAQELGDEPVVESAARPQPRVAAAAAAEEPAAAGEEDRPRRKRRRRKRRHAGETDGLPSETAPPVAGGDADADDGAGDDEPDGEEAEAAPAGDAEAIAAADLAAAEAADHRRRRRGKRGGRRRRRDDEAPLGTDLPAPFDDYPSVLDFAADGRPHLVAADRVELTEPPPLDEAAAVADAVESAFDAAPAVPETEGAASAPEAAEPVATLAEAVAEETAPPKRRRAPRRKVAEAAAEPVAAAPEPEAEAAPPPKPARRARSRKAVVVAPAEATPAETPSPAAEHAETLPPEDMPAAAPDLAPVMDAAPALAESEATADGPVAEAELETVSAAPEPESADRPRRTGWWKRVGSE